MSEREPLERAIAALEAQRTVLGDAVVDASIAALRQQLAALEAPPHVRGAYQERKQVTVLFADVSSFTAIAESMDAEDVSDLMHTLWARLDAVISEHGGRVSQHMGDAVMALWGGETAREDDPERAIQAALAIQAELATFREEQGMDLAMRIGINTGPVLLSQVDTTGELTVIGDTVNTASRLEGAAPVGGILISHDTYRHVRGVFDVQVLEPIQVRGKREPIQVYVVERAKPRAFRKGTRGVEGIETRMIGREAELERLQEAFRAVMDAEGGQRQMVTITGEAGVGKSRLLYEFENWLELLPEAICTFKGRASLEIQNLPYALIRDLFTFRFQIQDSDRSGTVRQKVEAGIGEMLGTEEGGRMQAHFIGQLLGFDFADSPYLQEALGDARQLRGRAVAYLSDCFKANATRMPTVILLEDVHWADDSSLDVIEHLARATPEQRLLIVCLARPNLLERRPAWNASDTSGQPFHTRMALSPLSKQDSRRLVEEILQKVEEVPLALRELVVGGAEGNPFYVEELIKMLIEDGVIIKGEERWRVEPVRLTAVRVPPTLTGVLQARLDSLPLTEKTILQRASVVGRAFWDNAVVRISESASQRIGALAREPAGAEQISNALSALQGKEMIFRRQTSAFAGTQEYIFKHAILREVTYESVLKRLRRVYHALAAEWLMERSGERAGEVTGLIADHLELAGWSEQALTYLRRAGEQAAAQFANAEAVNYLSRALDLTPEGAQAQRYALLLAREKVYDAQGRREPQRQDLAALEKLARAMDDERRQAGVALRQANYAQVTGDYPAVIAAAQAAIRLCQAAQDVEAEAVGYRYWGSGLWYQGKYEAARSRLEQALALARATGSRQVEADSLHALGAVSIRQGDFSEARAYDEQALDIYREIGHRWGESASLNTLGAVAAAQGDYAGASAYFEQALGAFREIGHRRGESFALINLGAVSLEQGDYAAAGAYYEQALGINREVGDRQGEGQALGSLGVVSEAHGDHARARTYHEQSLHICREVGDRRGEGNALNNLGTVSTAQGDYAGAGAYHEQALRIKRELGDRQGEGTVLSNLGVVSAAQGDYAGARTCYEQSLHICREIGHRLSEGCVLAHLSLLSHHLDDNEAARAYGQQALRIAEELGDRSSQGYALTNLGHGLAGQGQLAEAAAAYQQALALRRELGEHNRAMESLAGLARVALAEGALAQAQAQVEEILSHLETRTLEGTREPSRVYLTCYRVLRASGDPRARPLLEAAHRSLQEQAAGISDEELRRSFLENVAAHREIVSEWQVACSDYR